MMIGRGNQRRHRDLLVTAFLRRCIARILAFTALTNAAVADLESVARLSAAPAALDLPDKRYIRKKHWSDCSAKFSQVVRASPAQRTTVIYRRASMIPFAFSYASPSAFNRRERAQLGLSANALRPVRF